jgi:hypothetical protein
MVLLIVFLFFVVFVLWIVLFLFSDMQTPQRVDLYVNRPTKPLRQTERKTDIGKGEDRPLIMFFSKNDVINTVRVSGCSPFFGWVTH